MDQLALLGAEYLPTTPVRRQYLDIKAKYPDAILFFRLGDFYETFDDDAKTVARTLDIVLTGRDIGRGERAPMAGVPYHAAEGYIARLIERGHRVAICDQIGEVPARGLVRREVVRVISPGTLIEDGLLPARANNFLAAAIVERGAAGLAWVDVSTGQLSATEVRGPAWEGLLASELVRLGPSECLIPAQDVDDAAQSMTALLPPGARATPRPVSSFAPHRAVERLRRHFQTATVASLGLEERPLASRATAAVLEYVEENLPAALSLLDRLDLYAVEGSMVLDSATRRSLELTESLRNGQRDGSLLAAIDQTATAMGARALRRWLTQPLLDLTSIRERHDAVGWLVDCRLVRGGLLDTLSALPDLERLASRAAQRALNPREILAIARAVRRLPSIAEALRGDVPSLLADLHEMPAGFESLADRIVTCVEDPPAAQFGEGVIKAGCSAELDEVRLLAGDTKAWIADLERSERERTGLRQLKVGYNRVFGYYLEVSRAALAQPTDYYQREKTGATTASEHLERLEYVRKQTMTGVERFVTPKLQEYELRARNAQEEIVRLERAVFAGLLDAAAEVARLLLDVAAALGRLDALTGLAETAVRHDYVRPDLSEDGVLEIVGGRHPVVEQAIGREAFMPNDTRLGVADGVIAILTGPNMAGKSTYLRQVALIALLAQAGSFVPAASARLSIVDRVFARVGAQDDLAGQRSTFMVEMIETANILRNATPRSLLVLDEIGRGTSTFDGIAVARAIVEHLHENPRLRCKTLFATHYHELADLAEELPGVTSLQVEVLERGQQVVFLHRVAPGAADRSYGVHVARLAGVPEPVARRAAEILHDLEQARDRQAARPGRLLSGVAASPRSAGEAEALRRLRTCEPLRMSPLDALAELMALADLVSGADAAGDPGDSSA
ncbi:MAG: DNA mismatch repair protein MutS [Chloroflexi bacterium]|nr:DNA mismatch repair protein MutS [Chloroflexota bacterium]